MLCSRRNRPQYRSCPSVRLSVCLSPVYQFTSIPYALLTRKQKNVEKPKLVWTFVSADVPFSFERSRSGLQKKKKIFIFGYGYMATDMVRVAQCLVDGRTIRHWAEMFFQFCLHVTANICLCRQRRELDDATNYVPDDRSGGGRTTAVYGHHHHYWLHRSPGGHGEPLQHQVCQVSALHRPRVRSARGARHRHTTPGPHL